MWEDAMLEAFGVKSSQVFPWLPLWTPQLELDVRDELVLLPPSGALATERGIWGQERSSTHLDPHLDPHIWIHVQGYGSRLHWHRSPTSPSPPCFSQERSLGEGLLWLETQTEATTNSCLAAVFSWGAS